MKKRRPGPDLKVEKVKKFCIFWKGKFSKPKSDLKNLKAKPKKVRQNYLHLQMQNLKLIESKKKFSLSDNFVENFFTFPTLDHF